MEKKEVKHCCKNMDFFLKEEKVKIYYNPINREYFIGLKSFLDSKYPIYNCPWCGHKFPDSLVDEYYETLLNEYNIYINEYNGKYYKIKKDEQEEYIDIPKEFKSDEWWKKRGL